MGIRLKFNLALLFVAAIGAVMIWGVATPYLRAIATDEIMQHSRIMMESAAGTRKYTTEQITPLLIEGMSRRFHPQSVAAYAAKRNFDVLREKFNDYQYREPALNPTNLEDRAVDWEADIINSFRNNPDKHELTETRDTAMGPMLELARPIVSSKACLQCHSVPGAAPASMVALYGAQNGFGWKENEIIGAQVVTVPMTVAIHSAERVRTAFILPFLGIAILMFLLLNLLLHFAILAPIDRLAKMADAVSVGEAGVPEYKVTGNDQIARLSTSFNRMRRSLTEAFRLLDEDPAD